MGTPQHDCFEAWIREFVTIKTVHYLHYHRTTVGTVKDRLKKWGTDGPKKLVIVRIQQFDFGKEIHGHDSIYQFCYSQILISTT